MRVTSKGQVTIPLEVRRRLGITAGTEVDFEVAGDDVRLVRRSPGDGVLVVAGMRGLASTVRTDDVMALTRGDD